MSELLLDAAGRRRSPVERVAVDRLELGGRRARVLSGLDCAGERREALGADGGGVEAGSVLTSLR